MTAVHASAEDRWLAARRELITASDIPAIIGIDKRRGPLTVWLEKVEGIRSEETLPMRRGRRHQRLIAQEYGEDTGRPIRHWPEYEIARHSSIPWLGATLDAEALASVRLPFVEATASIWIPVEIKLAIGAPADWREDAPLPHQCQGQVQAQCTGSPMFAVAGWVGPGPLAKYDLERDDAFFSVLVPRLEEFWLRVKRREPPPADALPGTSEALRLAYPHENGETVALPDDTLALIEEWEARKAGRDGAGDAAREVENELRRRMGPASFGAVTDGSFLTLPVTKRKAYTVEATTYRRLGRFWPKRRNR